ncbi:RNA polymerase sigma factor [Hymenobacter guriensis]|uniref:Sigma-70 family RNA polymerase sigma factor n=1 Tax=Hymenobacter guriensis TaxID=2793065 RepID=A0ABS0L7Y4_9BACT|nr:sigma-70 family RNA polymerase sigma factor [Hymenobacter guriensis]MBG8556176.1 sigma-70 family RNA polymerase sigma factor [Hymenobacter guriensis]
MNEYQALTQLLLGQVRLFYQTDDERHLAPVFYHLTRYLDRNAKSRLRMTCPDRRHDLVQDTILGILTGLRKRHFDPGPREDGSEGPILGWAARILHNQHAALFRGKKIPGEPTAAEDPFLHLPASVVAEPDEIELHLGEEQAATVLGAATKAVLALPGRLRECVILAQYYGLPRAPAAAYLGISETLFRDRLCRAMRLLRQWAEQHPQLAPTPEVYAALSGVDTGALFRERQPVKRKGSGPDRLKMAS